MKCGTKNKEGSERSIAVKSIKEVKEDKEGLTRGESGEGVEVECMSVRRTEFCVETEVKDFSWSDLQE